MRFLKEQRFFLSDFRRSVSRDLELVHGSMPTSVHRHQVWSAPPLNFLKVNWDATTNLSKGCIGLGIVIRNSIRDFLEAKCIMHPRNLEASLGEALAAFWTVKFCLEMGFHEVIF
jgi:hypothetical protein